MSDINKSAGRMQYTYKTRKDAEEARKYWATKAGRTSIRRNRRVHGDTFTLVVQF